MAETVHLFLKAGNAIIKGESSQKSLGRADSIECLYFDHSVTTPREAGSGMATGKRQYSPILIRKHIDKSTPLLFKALTTNQLIEGTFNFFRPNPTGNGTTEHFYTINIKKGRVIGVRDYVADILNPATQTYPALEEVSFVFEEITWTYVNGGVTHQDNWSTIR